MTPRCCNGSNSMDGYPKLALIVEIDEVYFHCGKALIRSKLWDPTRRSSPR